MSGSVVFTDTVKLDDATDAKPTKGGSAERKAILERANQLLRNEARRQHALEVMLLRENTTIIQKSTIAKGDVW